MIKWRSCSHRSAFNRVSAFSKIRTSHHWLAFSGALMLGLVPLEGRGAKVVSQEDLARLPSGRPAVVYVQDFKVEKQSSGEDRQSLAGGRARAIIAEVRSATGKPLCGRGEVRHVPARSAEEHSANRTDDCRRNYSPSPTIAPDLA
jgi:hypothetical protein